MIRKSLPFAILAACTAASFAQTKPNFTGDWKLDTLRSRMDAKSDVKNESMKIAHTEPHMKIELATETEHGSQSHVFELQTDGRESKQSLDNQPCKTTAKWQDETGERIIIATTCTTSDGTASRIRELKLSNEGKMLTTTLVVKDAHGQMKSYEFFTKE